LTSCFTYANTESVVELAYIVKYVEDPNLSRTESNLQMTAVYCDIVSGNNAHARWKFLHHGASLASCIDSASKDNKRVRSIIDDPMVMHELVLTQSLLGWSQYMLSIEQKLIDIENDFLEQDTVSASSMSPSYNRN
jgi:hypothetical protein